MWRTIAAKSARSIQLGAGYTISYTIPQLINIEKLNSRVVINTLSHLKQICVKNADVTNNCIQSISKSPDARFSADRFATDFSLIESLKELRLIIEFNYKNM